ncbi:cyclodeaminase/cyclohydrolase family protein [Treponema sp. TIM-1]|uniref:cyclodeaminase/cyclohydrolase family protein n=1 Tax=Treponema sp. TIM-1 TaxID=2898417 RepID=UPI00397FAD7F
MNFAEISCAEFISRLGSKAPVPGGGGASALVGAVGTALGNMVGALTVGKKKYAEVEGDMIRLREAAEKLQGEFLTLVQRDAEVFEPLSRAYGLPKETEAQREEKDRVMEAALKEACSVPLEIMSKCGEAIRLHEEFAAKGSRLAVSDAGVGAAFCKAALLGASLNVYINTGAMKDRALAGEYNRKADALLAEYGPCSDRIFESVKNYLKKE